MRIQGLKNTWHLRSDRWCKKLKVVDEEKAADNQGKPEEEVVSGTGSVVADRNELIKQILANKPDEVDKDK